jgi:putative Mg2+ transporter-C (MgtC) family protein
MGMTISWEQIGLRLTFTVIAGIVLGINRDEKGRPAGIRTNVLVCLAASLSMLQMNLLMGTVGKASDSFVVLDLMRLPLGILSGMGFIGAGAILRKGEMVLGVTTAATLWTATVLGLCFGGGQVQLGIAGLVIASLTLWGLKWLEHLIPRQRRGMLSLTLDQAKTTERNLRDLLQERRFQIHSWGISAPSTDTRRIEIELRWKASPLDPFPPNIVGDLIRTPGISLVAWKP